MQSACNDGNNHDAPALSLAQYLADKVTGFPQVIWGPFKAGRSAQTAGQVVRIDLTAEAGGLPRIAPENACAAQVVEGIFRRRRAGQERPHRLQEYVVLSERAQHVPQMLTERP